ncbi:amino acid adenylation domain-containing protein, partial [Streptosporangium algeriense]
MLRTVFPVRDGRPEQVILHAVEVPWSVEEAADRDEAAVWARLVEAVRVPFDLAVGPLLRVCVLRVGDREHLLALSVHHIVFDGWSQGVLLREWARFYEARLCGEPAGLPVLPVQFADVAVWQREWLAEGGVAEQLGYWRERLAGAPVALELPADRVRPVVQSHQGAFEPLTLEPELVGRLREMCEREGLTLFMVLLAGFKIVLARYTGSTDIVVGTPIANRNRVELEPLIGFLVNTLALRTDLGGDPTVADVLDRVRETCLGAYANQDLPFEQLVEELQPVRDLSRSPVVQVVFSLLNAPWEDPVFPGLSIEPVEADPQVAKLDLSLFFSHAGEALVGGAEYASDLFDAVTVRRLFGHYRMVLESLAGCDPAVVRLSQVDVLSAAERAELVAAGAAQPVRWPGDGCLHELVQRQADRAPEAAAIVCGDLIWSYRRLEGQANRIARGLRASGVGPGDVVALCVGRTPYLVAGLLGILKAGAAYLPLDPALPDSRVRYMLADAGARVVLGDRDTTAALPVECLELDDPTLWDGYDDTRLDVPVTVDDLAYVIYTSGSTGRPKGVMIPHAAIVNLAHSMGEHLRLDESDKVLALTTISFDIAALELFGPLTHGGSVVMATRDQATDGRALSTMANTCGVTLIQATPSGWRALLDTGWTSPPEARALCGGEELPLDVANRLTAAFTQVWNVYGPTETTVWSLIAPLRGDDVVPLGGPLANTSVYIVDDALNLVPDGITGELLIGGTGLAHGYHNRPALTSERFVPDPYGPPGSRLYRTGDLVRRRSNGTLEFLGRADHQIKLRGFRIELGEI